MLLSLPETLFPHPTHSVPGRFELSDTQTKAGPFRMPLHLDSFIACVVKSNGSRFSLFAGAMF